MHISKCVLINFSTASSTVVLALALKTCGDNALFLHICAAHGIFAHCFCFSGQMLCVCVVWLPEAHWPLCAHIIPRYLSIQLWCFLLAAIMR